MTEEEMQRRIEDDDYTELTEEDRIQFLNFVTQKIVRKIILSEKTT